MPSEKILAKKKLYVTNLAKEIKSSLVGVLVDYKGINVTQDTALRKKMRDSGVDYRVIKNTLLKRALVCAEICGLEDVLTGTTALATSKVSYSDVSKIICDFAKGKDFYKIKAGFVEGIVMNSKEAINLAKLPTREQLISQALSGMNAPILGLVLVLNGILCSFLFTINAIVEKKNQSGN
ncbi:MAG: 50S ribosomal protein L10 [Oscillospiraceae bacterium]|jgi:large subunit ribosomal protein L10|nr:50S ribosomal protein L10 [Oscillospiraceae bacterium]